MALGETLHARGGGLGSRGRLAPGGRLAPLGYAALAVLVAVWAWRAFHDASTYDAGLAYVGGQVAWASGHPERWFSWTGTPFFAAVMGLVSTPGKRCIRCQALDGAERRPGHRRGRRGPPAPSLPALARVVVGARVALLTFGPILSSVWWKQINVVCIVLALGGFELLRRGREHAGAGVIALSLALKPLAILLPLVLLVRRETRRGRDACRWFT